MRDDDVRHEFLNFLERGQIVLVDVDDYVRRMQLAQNIELDVLRAADLRHVAHGVARMNTESGAANHLRVEAEAEEKLGDRWHQRDDARVCVGARMHVAGGIDTAHRRIGYQCAVIQIRRRRRAAFVCDRP